LAYVYGPKETIQGLGYYT